MFERFSNSFLKDFDLSNLLGKFRKVCFRSYRKGEFIYRKNDKVEQVYFLLSGEVSVGSFSDDSEIRAMSHFRQGEVIGIDDALHGARYSGTAMALTDVNVVEVCGKELLELTQRNDEFNLWMLKFLSSKISAIS